MDISNVLTYLYPKSRPMIEWVVAKDADGVVSIEEWNLDEDQPTNEHLMAVSESDGYRSWLLLKASERIDRSTGSAITAAIHPTCGIDEQLGVLRDQIARMLNGDMTPSEDFTRLNEIAIAEIEKDKAVKDAESN